MDVPHTGIPPVVRDREGEVIYMTVREASVKVRRKSVLKVIDTNKTLRYRPVDSYVRVPGIPGQWRIGTRGALVVLYPINREAVRKCGDKVQGIVVFGDIGCDILGYEKAR